MGQSRVSVLLEHIVSGLLKENLFPNRAYKEKIITECPIYRINEIMIK